jgi:hypothetical protein
VVCVAEADTDGLVVEVTESVRLDGVAEPPESDAVADDFVNDSSEPETLRDPDVAEADKDGENDQVRLLLSTVCDKEAVGVLEKVADVKDLLGVP